MDDQTSVSKKRNFKNPNRAGRKCVVCGAKPINCPERKFHSFPQNPFLSNKWAEIVGRKDIINASTKQRCSRYRICSNHFAETDYVSCSKMRFVGHVVPKLNMPSSMIKVDLSKMKKKIHDLMSSENTDLDALPKNFEDLFGDSKTCDTTLNVKDKEYKAHRSVLIARSSVFAATLKHDTQERHSGVVTISDCDPDSFEVFLKFLYCGILEEISYRSALNLYYTSNKYDVEELKVFCIDYLMKNVTVENICEVAVFADKYDETALSSAVQDFFNKNAREIFLTPEWKCFMKENNDLASKLLIEMSNVRLKD